ncbi:MULTISPECIES: LPS biosynthesis protein [Pseudoalteromonas]|uniref:LPS biosynthesis protein n=1 Tax=Pseudoalteromonas TaxID=53246 RepID=UPI0002C90ACD|nr:MULTISPECIES: LPS biosynthesis protein [Pseudoalteromonas]ENO00766.1 lipopolysaccharide biosynthesis protein [Pseudoalteromonas agarivorans S816]TMS66300.1 lipopolysaccharide biosynthesis protein [Pseudoalteromonas sp. S1691]TMS66879.1 lipopolysaccharide biosynthesis protein [Pseudoalteromonas sp. S1731]TMS74540.1 lipopolysaccharide biosynthesis protein [Pseudoalteromonas sp. S1941]TMS75951.1 lipopolysaccharide biosynthesis protein [Pseudoalteromonas sp. S1690]
MSQQAVKKIEQRFTELGLKTDKAIWDNGEKLIGLAQQVEQNDVYLARRVMQRARNLKPKNEQINKELARLTNKINSKAKQTQTSTSTEQHVKPNIKQSAIAKLNNKRGLHLLTKPWFVLLLVPFVLFAFYQLVLAAPRYESRAQLIIQQPDGMSTMDPSMALLSGLGVGGSSTADSEIAKAYIHSQDMLNYLQQHSNLKAHYQHHGDIFTGLSSDASSEDLLNYYIDHTTIEIDEDSGVLKILAQGFTPEFANNLTKIIVSRAEWYINSIGHQLAEAQLQFIRLEHAKVEQRLRDAQKNILAFQQKNNLLDPEAEGLALQQITYGLEGQIATKSAQLKGLRLTMTDRAPQVVMLEAELNALKTQLELERERLSQQGSEPTNTTANNRAVSQVLAQFSDLKIELELALKGYTASEVSLDKARIEAYRQLKYLVVVESATLPQDHQYPNTLYNILLFAVLQLMLFGIGKIILATVKELR